MMAQRPSYWAIGMMLKISTRCCLSIGILFGLRIDMESNRSRVIMDGAA